MYDKNNQNPIEFANISIKNTAPGTTTDATGKFKINIAMEKQTVIIVSHISYHNRRKLLLYNGVSGSFLR